MKYKENLKRSQRKEICYLQKSNNMFPGRLVLKEDSKWVSAAVAPHRGSLGGPSPHPGKENTGAEKGPLQERDRRSCSRSLHRKCSRSPRQHRSTSPSPSQLKERRDEKKEKKSKEHQITEEDRGQNSERNRNGELRGFAPFDSTKGKR